MKTSIAIMAAAAVLGLNAQKALADGGWATTGKILTGLVIGGAVARAFEPPPTVVYTAPVVYTPAPTYTYAPAPVVAAAPVAAPAPVYVQAAPAPVYVQPAPVVVYSAPVYRPYYYYGPHYYCGGPYWGGPVVSFRFGFGGGHWHHR